MVLRYVKIDVSQTNRTLISLTICRYVQLMCICDQFISTYCFKESFTKSIIRGFTRMITNLLVFRFEDLILFIMARN
jgi:hypothetical protein